MVSAAVLSSFGVRRSISRAGVGAAGCELEICAAGVAGTAEGCWMRGVDGPASALAITGVEDAVLQPGVNGG